ncbi:unnamed protein product [Amoebophrya sp. A120]|nr:unnamed protein product [Amoebophrya sp. A120]|eukprot:GSA120T00017768001.1
MADDLEVETTSYQRQKDAGLFRDPVPGVRPAGKSTSIFNDTTERDLQSDIYFPRPPTPPSQRKFRKNLVPGEIHVHHGLSDQKLPSDDFRYGIHSDRGETVERTFKDGLLLGIAAYKNQCAESVYKSTKMEPLGHSYVRGHELPGLTKEQKFVGFGKESLGAGEDGKEIIFPRGVEPDTKEITELYRFTHGNFGPGEQADRKYAWPQAIEDPDFRYGVTEKDAGGEKGGVAGALDWTLDEAGKMAKTRIGRKTLADFRDVTHEKLGKPRNYCQGTHPTPARGFGIVSAGANDTAAKCMQGTYTDADNVPDANLGKCTIPGRTNVSRDPKRLYGVPSVRIDIPAPDPAKRSCADMQNYGDEIGAGPLLNPQRFEIKGIMDSEFLVRRDREECRTILKGAGYQFEHFDHMFDAALELFDDGIPLVSLDALLFLQGNKIEQNVERAIRGS